MPTLGSHRNSQTPTPTADHLPSPMIKCNSSDVFFFIVVVGPPGASSGDLGSEVGQVADNCLTAAMRWDGIESDGYMVYGVQYLRLARL